MMTAYEYALCAAALDNAIATLATGINTGERHGVDTTTITKTMLEMVALKAKLTDLAEGLS